MKWKEEKEISGGRRIGKDKRISRGRRIENDKRICGGDEWTGMN